MHLTLFSSKCSFRQEIITLYRRKMCIYFFILKSMNRKYMHMDGWVNIQFIHEI